MLADIAYFLKDGGLGDERVFQEGEPGSERGI